MFVYVKRKFNLRKVLNALGFDVFVHGPKGESLKTLDFSQLRLLTYA